MGCLVYLFMFLEALTGLSNVLLSRKLLTKDLTPVYVGTERSSWADSNLFQTGRASVEKGNFELGRLSWDSRSKGMLCYAHAVKLFLDCVFEILVSLFVFSTFYYLLAFSCFPFKFLFHVVFQHAYRDYCPFQHWYALLEPVSFSFLNHRKGAYL